MPVIKHLDGVCHVYIDDKPIGKNHPRGRQCQDPAFCPVQHHANALLVNENVAES